MEDEIGLATRAAWMHYAGGLTQSEVAERLGITRLKAHRLVARAVRDGLVRVFIDGEIADCAQMEGVLAAAYALDVCRVVPTLDDDPLPIKALGIAGAQYLKSVLERDEDTLIGVGHGRTLAACADNLVRMALRHTRFVSLLGGLTRKYSANPHDVIYRLADRTGAEAYVLPVPFVANSIEDRAVLMAQRGVTEVFDLARRASLLVVGLGAVEKQASLIATGMLDRTEMEQVRRDGGCGEVLGWFFDRAGRPVETEVSRRTLTLDLDDLRRSRMVAIAGGVGKVDAIASILASGLLKGLVTDERTARALVDRVERPRGPAKRSRE